MPTGNRIRDFSRNNMTAQNYIGQRGWNPPPWFPGGLPNQMSVPLQGIQQPTNGYGQVVNSSYASNINNYWTNSNNFQYRPNTRCSVQHLRSRHVNRVSRTHRHNVGFHGRSTEYVSDDSDDDDGSIGRMRQVTRNIHRLNRLNNRFHSNSYNRVGNEENDENDSSATENNNEDDQNCCICGDALQNSSEIYVHMCNGEYGSARHVLTDEKDWERNPDSKEHDDMVIDDTLQPSTSSELVKMIAVDEIKLALKAEKEQVTNLRQEASDLMLRLKEKEKSLNKLETDLDNKAKKIAEDYETGKTEVKRLKRQLQDECKRMEEQHKQQKGYVQLNVGGHIFTTSTSTLCVDSNSMLAAMFSGRHEVVKQLDGSVFLDRDGTHFRYILNYLRDGPASLDTLPRTRHVLREIRNEAAFYQLTGLIQYIETLLA